MPAYATGLRGKWVLEVLFDGDLNEANQVLDAAIEAITNPSAVAGVTLLADLDAWEACRCGRRHDEVSIG